LNFNPEYRTIAGNVELGQERNMNGEMIMIYYTSLGSVLSAWCTRRTTHDLNVKDREFIKKVKAGEIEVEGNESNESIVLDYNTNVPFTKVILKDEDGNKRFDQELSRYWKEKLSGVHKMKSVMTPGPDTSDRQLGRLAIKLWWTFLSELLKKWEKCNQLHNKTLF